MATRKFLVEISEDDIYEAGAVDIHRQALAKHIRAELQASGGVYSPGAWQFRIFNNVKVTPIDDEG
jgi:hypothetical protein